MEMLGIIFFALALAHMFATGWFSHRAHRGGRWAPLWELLGEVEIVFGTWAMLFLLVIAFLKPDRAWTLLRDLEWSEPVMIAALMLVASSEPIVIKVRQGFEFLAKGSSLRFYFLVLTVLPLAGSLLTEPVVMTLAALLLLEWGYRREASLRFRYTTLAILLVNVSLGGALSPYAAPPILLVAKIFQWGLPETLSLFGGPVVMALLTNTLIAFTFNYRECSSWPMMSSSIVKASIIKLPRWSPWLHGVVLITILLIHHNPWMTGAVALVFIAGTRWGGYLQNPLLIQKSFGIGFFIFGVLVLGEQQKFWIEPLLSNQTNSVVFASSLGLSAIVDNALVTFLGSQLPNTDALFPYALVAGALAGGGLTVMANAPNPTAFTLLEDTFHEGIIRPFLLFTAALIPTVVAISWFWWWK